MKILSLLVISMTFISCVSTSKNVDINRYPQQVGTIGSPLTIDHNEGKNIIYKNQINGDEILYLTWSHSDVGYILTVNVVINNEKVSQLSVGQGLPIKDKNGNVLYDKEFVDKTLEKFDEKIKNPDCNEALKFINGKLRATMLAMSNNDLNQSEAVKHMFFKGLKACSNKFN